MRGLKGLKGKEVREVKVKVKCTLVQVLKLCTGPTPHRGSRGIALLSLDHGTRREWGASVTLRLLFTPGKDPIPIVQEAEWVPGPVWTGAENLAPPGFDPLIVQPVASRYTDWATGPISSRRYFYSVIGVRAMVRAVIRRRLARRNMVRCQTVPCRIGGGWSSNRRDFCPNTSIFPRQYRSNTPPCSFRLSTTLRSWNMIEIIIKWTPLSSGLSLLLLISIYIDISIY